jgi:hypothetical protein
MTTISLPIVSSPIRRSSEDIRTSVAALLQTIPSEAIFMGFVDVYHAHPDKIKNLIRMLYPNRFQISEEVPSDLSDGDFSDFSK